MLGIPVPDEGCRISIQPADECAGYGYGSSPAYSAPLIAGEGISIDIGWSIKWGVRPIHYTGRYNARIDN